MKFEDLTPEQQEKAKACKSPEDILALAKKEGYELSDEQLEGISGGFVWDRDSDCSDNAPVSLDQNVTIPGDSNTV